MSAIIKWNAERNGVEVQTNGEHFVIDAMPSRIMSWHEAVRFYQNADGWKLPTVRQMLCVAKHIDEVNSQLEQHGGFKPFGWHWCSDEVDEFCAWYVSMDYGYTYYGIKDDDFYVRAVFDFQN